MRLGTLKALHLLGAVICWTFVGYCFVSLANNIKSVPLSTLAIAGISALVGILIWEGITKIVEEARPRSEDRGIVWDYMSPAMRRLAIEEWHLYHNDQDKQERKLEMLREKKADMERTVHILRTLHSRMQARYMVNYVTRQEEIEDTSMAGTGQLTGFYHYVGFTHEEYYIMMDAALTYAEELAWNTIEEELAEIPCIFIDRRFKREAIEAMYRIRRAIIRDTERSYNKWYDYFYTERDGVWNLPSSRNA